MMETKIIVRGMACGGCSATIKNALSAIAGVEDVKADHRSGEVCVRHSGVSEEILRKAISEAGYDPQ
ncbi:MAG: P-type Cu+ transporter [Candidatus Methanomethylophilaceae archaeon]|nr:P-type Cu+ transporter [Candidatus Methanomethylophilaceae archaeon]MDI3542091.1 P-type Cu+ transporter [Candidatus Methanomethylophilaceae archaeon]